MPDSLDPLQELEHLAEKPLLELRAQDANHNGVLELEEFVGNDALADKAKKAREFEQFDTNHDGVLTDAELKAGRKQQREA
jgi:hypothetical protein